ncbi:unnamed protein product [Gadus morhua 'NCC']
MVYYCVCGGCNNSSKSGHRVHCFPKDKGIFQSWVQFVKVRRAGFSASSVTAHSRICSAHFKEEDYHSGDAKMVSLGLKSERLAKLIPTAVPSVHANLSACPVPRSRDTVCRKRESATMLTDASQQETVDSVDTVESVDTGDQPLPSSTSDAGSGTQCYLKPPRWSHVHKSRMSLSTHEVEETHQNKDASPYISDTDSEDEPKLPLNQFYPYIRCGLCCGFLIDATTITECLHTFCKSCIVKHFFYGNRCPTCSIVVHQTQPLYNIRPDRQLQDIVYKMIPFLEELERDQMCNFYKQRGMEVPKPVVLSPPTPTVARKPKKDTSTHSVFTIPPELDVSLLLQFVGAEDGIKNYKPLERRYVRVSGEATVRHVELFIRRKMELSPTCQVDMVCGDHLLDHDQSLKQIQNTMGEEAVQDGLLVLHFGLVLPNES